MKRIILAMIVAAITSCGFNPVAPQGAQYFPTPEIYYLWWAELTECAGVGGDLNDVRFYSVVQDSVQGFNCVLGKDGCGGLWHDDHEIYLDERLLFYQRIVKHEMLHELLRPGKHTDERFLRCAGI